MNLANRLTILRIFLIPVFMIFLLNKIPYGVEIAAFIFIIAAITDALDGYVARKKNQITTLGKFMDPLADKLLVSAALISLVQMGKLSALVVIIIIAREFTISILRAVAAAEGVVIAASWWGKLKTITQIIAIIAVLIDNFPFKYINFPFDMIMVWVAVIFTIISGIDYIRLNSHVLKH
ncbi:CDP-diacylglycerol--glycerol-3-phosphate 3-phosphatidyltransferase [Clostridium formicaceticum]|uniref:CDP-diacylglycerol--glycerol-3-phosphate 3-phosphatidyltransferase n=1 Tax=Clostridium formicaceticum TaxID=1497 RepID=A0AAC9RP58_9CLOT|nr:CDP-diacylglycerol--glycerol-3-phosphate 3-phosphatidyltransferase [Clostridium formicaceticum]AOY77263.1 CDP-diacylglycerol--glycerol-3-phosphate 3-phosphatidyltransferase [Clostridium formicaceticum]ARE87800.1 CDP-diacylglycerol--glycerol-3-phosphate 3-phosphatidyltransferase [Clostridium formicaceticum]